MTQAISRRLVSIQLMTKVAFQELTQNQLMTQVDSPGIDSASLMTQSAFPFSDSTQLMIQAKSIWFGVDSWFYSDSYPCLVHSVMKEKWKIILCWCMPTACCPNGCQIWCFSDKLNHMTSFIHFYKWIFPFKAHLPMDPPTMPLPEATLHHACFNFHHFQPDKFWKTSRVSVLKPLLFLVIKTGLWVALMEPNMMAIVSWGVTQPPCSICTRSHFYRSVIDNCCFLMGLGGGGGRRGPGWPAWDPAWWLSREGRGA